MIKVVGDPVIHLTNGMKGVVVETNSFYGWFRVKWEDGRVKEYSGHGGTKPTVVLDWAKLGGYGKVRT